MHILIIPSGIFITPRESTLGVFQHEQAKALKKSGHKVGVISVADISAKHVLSSYPYSESEILDGIVVIRNYRRAIVPGRYQLPSVKIRQYTDRFHTAYQQYEAQHGRPDIVHAHGFKYGAFLASSLRMSNGVPFIVTEHSSELVRGMVPRALLTRMLEPAKTASVLTGVSKYFCEHLSATFQIGFEVFPNIVDTRFTEGEIPQPESSSFRFFSLGNLETNKNHASLITAFAEEFDGTNTHLVIGGAGPLKTELKKWAQRLGIAEKVEFLGHLNRDEVATQMGKAHCFVLPSEVETFGVVLIEALATGLPVIATRSGGPQDIVNTRNGILIDVGSVSQLRQAMRNVYEQYDRFCREEIRADAVERFGASAFVRRAESLYQSACAMRQ